METGGGFGLGDWRGRSGGSASSSSAEAEAEEAAAVSKSLLLPSFSSAVTASATAAAAALSDTLFLSPSSASSSSPGGMMGNTRALFTLAQREELERQTLIFKYMVASIPVPPQLLLPLKTNTILGSTRISSSSSSDPEPWRCKRTDGKKWRCSRDVAPHQKYCERHSHKNRPRSRKPVEFLGNNTTNKTLMRSRESSFVGSSITSQDTLSHLVPYHTNKEFSHTVGSPAPRSLEWFMKGEVIAIPNSSDQLEWQQQHQHGPLSPYRPDQELQAHGGGGGGLANDQCSLLLGMASMEGHNCPNSRASGSFSKRLPTSSLSLAMFGGGGEGDDDERESLGQMGLGVGLSSVGGSGECDRRAESKPHWMSPGGPLAEALCLGTMGTGTSSSSDRT